MSGIGKRLDRLEVRWPPPGRVGPRRIAEQVAAETGATVEAALAEVEAVIARGPVPADGVAAAVAADLAAELGVPVERALAEVEQIIRERPRW